MPDDQETTPIVDQETTPIVDGLIQKVGELQSELARLAAALKKQSKKK